MTCTLKILNTTRIPKKYLESLEYFPLKLLATLINLQVLKIVTDIISYMISSSNTLFRLT